MIFRMFESIKVTDCKKKKKEEKAAFLTGKKKSIDRLKECEGKRKQEVLTQRVHTHKTK